MTFAGFSTKFFQANCGDPIPVYIVLIPNTWNMACALDTMVMSLTEWLLTTTTGIFEIVFYVYNLVLQANDVVFCGRIIMFLAHFFPLSERSGT